ncbi:hypothetical protein PoB_003024300 [Plakobranchus ocellatus]|uniref:Uncharacterized protein n=1 Tax=Plakobranchus ocellatus TaxID=259542 RepID=A0AAV4AAG5_9GAST|nr:hypothetical protein PoB_003024300 [Plakobranchus ocellatus]
MSDAEVEIEAEEMSREALARSGSQKETDGEAQTAGGDPKAQWSSQSYLLEEISQQFTLPQVVKCNAMSILTRRDQPIPINMASPLLLYDQRTIRKLLARNVLSDPRNGRYTETDETIVIPADYEGRPTTLNRKKALVKQRYKNPLGSI